MLSCTLASTWAKWFPQAKFKLYPEQWTNMDVCLETLQRPSKAVPCKPTVAFNPARLVCTLTSSFSIFRVARRDCSWWWRIKSSVWTGCCALTWHTWEYETSRTYPGPRLNTDEKAWWNVLHTTNYQTNMAALFCVDLPHPPCVADSRSMLEDRRSGCACPWTSACLLWCP